MSVSIRNLVLLALATATAQASQARKLKCAGQQYGSICTATTTEYKTSTEITTTVSTPTTATATSTIFSPTITSTTVPVVGQTFTSGLTVYYNPGVDGQGNGDITSVYLTNTRTVTSYLPTVPTPDVAYPECKSTTTTTVSADKIVTSTSTSFAPRPTTTVTGTSFLTYTQTFAAEPISATTTEYTTTYMSYASFSSIFYDVVEVVTTVVDSYVTAEATPTPV
ncbi:hypothetical protein Micbo1qcDRAFT_209776 [Microdochium bolleyi]|uniref:Uncharacterized protein n=1 Tax=Microdochium bolleyi TaxID=196109 RepID=A0A136ILJ2_9PEZI|nr:hypothetical protein Micbo1qcDRAFT_209776 [Microdochium bolleyi]